MRKFSSYGPVDKRLHYYAPRTALIDLAQNQLLGENPTIGGHYITVWAPRQTGKSWVMREVLKRVKAEGDFEIGVISMQSAKTITDEKRVLKLFVQKLQQWFGADFPLIQTWEEIRFLFTSDYFSKPVILIIDEFDALQETFINRFANEFREMYLGRIDEGDMPSGEKNNLLHGLALIGVRSVLGIENITGSPFNVQRSVHIPNLNREEVVQIFQDYQAECGQRISSIVVERIYDEMKGQPGLTCWLGELLTEVYNRYRPEISMREFNETYALALKATPNNNILNIVSKAKMVAYTPLILEMFKTDEKLRFRYDDPATNFLYMNGVVTHDGRQPAMLGTDNETDLELFVDESDGSMEDVENDELYLKFPSPFVQKRLFNYFSHQLFQGIDYLHDPFLDLADIITTKMLNVPNIVQLYEAYIQKNRAWIFRDAPRRRTDDRIYEAVYHFSLYEYLAKFLRPFRSSVVPEFPTGNGKIDLVIRHNKQLYALELKSFANQQQYKSALGQAAKYGQRLKLLETWLIFFVEAITDEQRVQYEATYQDATTGVVVHPVFVKTQ